MFCAGNCSESDTSSPNDTTTATSSLNPELDQESVVILSVMCALASFCGSFGNALVIGRNTSCPEIFKPSCRPHLIISSLAFSDFTVCFIYLPLSIYNYNHFTSQVTQQGSPFDIARSFFGHCTLIASVTNMFAVTGRPCYRHTISIQIMMGMVTSKTAFITIAIVWLISLTIGALYAREIFSRIILLGYCIVLMIGTMSMYDYIFFIAKRQENKVQRLKISAEQQLKAEKKAAKTIFTVVGIYALHVGCHCYFNLPIIVNPSKRPVLFKKAFPWVQAVLACNSALNPYKVLNTASSSQSLCEYSAWKTSIPTRSQMSILEKTDYTYNTGFSYRPLALGICSLGLIRKLMLKKR